MQEMNRRDSQLREEYRRRVERYEAQATEWAARAGREVDDALRAEYEAHARQARRAAETARRQLEDVERRMERRGDAQETP